MHTPVLLKDIVAALNVRAGGSYIDATYGEGGHSRAIADAGGRVLAIDLDADQLARATDRKKPDFRLVQGNFADIARIAQSNGFAPADGILFDLGLSMEQISNSGRGFSFKKRQDPLDMRLSLLSVATAADILQQAGEEELYDILARFGEDIHSALIARQIVVQRTKHKIVKVDDLMSIIHKVLTECRAGHYHNSADTAGRVFQALRMEVNGETENLKKGLAGAVNIIRENGRIAVLAFHSVEDRIVKQFIRENKLAVVEELLNNRKKRPFEKSAKLRVFAKNI